MGWVTGFLALLRYELLWNLRKKKILGLLAVVFILITLSLALPPILGPVDPDPYYVVRNAGAPPGPSAGLFFFFFALVVVMNSISTEFESGSIIPLLSKPVSRTSVFIAKLLAATLTIVGAYIVLDVYSTIGGIIV